MEPRRLVKKPFLLTIFLCVASSASAYPLLGNTSTPAPEVEPVEEEMEMPWSSRVQKILEKQQDKFSEIEHFYYFRHLRSDVVILLYLLFGMALAVYTFLLHPIFSGALPYRSMFVRIVLTLVMEGLLGVHAWYVYGWYAEKGYFFSTNKGILIIDPGYQGVFTWLPYSSIDRIEVLSNPEYHIPITILRITDKAGLHKDYRPELFPSPFMFQACYNGLINSFNKAKQAQKELKSKQPSRGAPWWTT